MTDKIIVLDRDGVINHDSDDYIKSSEEWIAIEGSIEAIVRLKKAGYQVAIATNQSGLGRGYFSEETLNAMHQKMQDLLSEHDEEVDLITYCPHHPDENCACRKPKTGMLEQIESELSVSLKGCAFVGDSLKDLEAGVAFNMQPILVKTGKGLHTLKKELPEATQVFESLSSYVDALLEG